MLVYKVKILAKVKHYQLTSITLVACETDLISTVDVMITMMLSHKL